MSRAQTLIDAHVHVHPGVDMAHALDAAARNMGRFEGATAVNGALLFTESAGVDAFGALPAQCGAWRIAPTEEPQSRIAFRETETEVGVGVGADGEGEEARLTLIAGRQIVTAEGLEVHGFGLTQEIPDGSGAAETIEALLAAGAVAALPWGFGKWAGRRGEIVRDLIRTAPRGVLLADSGARMKGAGRPPLLTEGEAAGRFALAGVDPLPLPGAAAKIGRYGVVADIALGDATPFADFARWTRGLAASPTIYGRLESPLAFVFAQIAMQARKRLR